MFILKIQGDLLNSQEEIVSIVQRLRSVSHVDDVAILINGRSKTEKELLKLTVLAEQQDIDLTASILSIESTYLNLARATLPVHQQSAVLSFVRKRFNEVDDICKGINLLGECPKKTKEDICAIPATVLSYIFSSACNSANIHTSWIKDPKDITDFNKGLYVIPDLTKNPARINDVITENTEQIELWTSTFTYYTADPNQVKNAVPISNMTYEEAMEMNWQEFNAPIHPSTLSIASKYHIPISIKEINQVALGETLISNATDSSNKLISGISYLDTITLIRIEGSVMIGVPGFAKRVFGTLHNSGINIIMISQDASEHSICVAVSEADGPLAESSLNNEFSDEIRSDTLHPVKAMENVSIIGLIGENMRSHPGISGKMFGALGRNGINILAIAQGSNERNISVVIDTLNRTKAVNVLHEAFFENVKKEVHLFIIGTGNVGKKLLGQLAAQAKTIEDKLGIRLNISGLCNSRKMIINKALDYDHCLSALENGEPSETEKFVDQIIELNKRNSVLVDMTASQLIPEYYKRLLKRSVSVVACNKIAASDRYAIYSELKELALSYNCKFLFETNVGAALPVISTLNDLIKSGDRILRIEAVLSGTLNYVFNHYDGSKTFSEVVRDAQQQGYTEPDPRLDLSGKDVMRKIMILAREAGETTEMEQINCEGFLPDSCMDGDVDNFYIEMRKKEDHFRGLLDNAKADHAKLKFVATYENNKAAVGLKHIHQQSDMYHLYGKDNIVLFYTERYREQPLVVKGAGAGAEVTASGVFADIIRTINH